MIRELRLFLIALQFLTRVPVPRGVGFEPEWLNRSARHFAGVGALVGLLAAAVLWMASRLWAVPVAVVVSMMATVWITGAFHEDGLADTCDALGGATTRERALEIMKDSRIGAYGAIGLALVLALKATALATMPLLLALSALVLGHTASRAFATVVMWRLPYAGDAAHAKAKPLARHVGAAEAAGALGWSAAVGALLIGAGWMDGRVAAVGLLVSALASALIARRLRARLGGFTGDTLGAVQQASEVVLLLGAAGAQRWLAGS